ncbi:MAG TPA: hypothetical protein VMU51_37380 [Mycobacteriales bacterium]|nr:hypothetical protein [Mycobacteriales bacterium]
MALLAVAVAALGIGGASMASAAPAAGAAHSSSPQGASAPTTMPSALTTGAAHGSPRRVLAIAPGPVAAFVNVNRRCDDIWVYGPWSVTVCRGFDYNPASNNLRGYGLMDGNDSRIHVQAEPLNLGDRNGVLASVTANSQTGLLEIDTGAVDCHRPNGIYRANMHYSIRWPDGVLTGGQQTGQYEQPASVICR